MRAPRWPNLKYAKIDYQSVSYYSAPKQVKKLNSLDEVDPILLETYEKLGISLTEQKRLNGVAVDAVFDSVSVATTFRKELESAGVIFRSISEEASLVERNAPRFPGLLPAGEPLEVLVDPA